MTFVSSVHSPLPTPKLLSPEAASDLAYWKRCDQDRLADSFKSAYVKWATSYGIDLSPAFSEFQCETIFESPTGSGLRWRSLMVPGGKQGIWWALKTANELTPYQILQSALFGDFENSTTAAPTVSSEVVECVWRDWCIALARLSNADYQGGPDSFNHDLTSEAHILPGSMLRMWSGTLFVSFSWCGYPVVFALSRETVASIIGAPSCSPACSVSREPLSPLLSTVANHSLHLKIELAPQNIDLGTLSRLAPGDVLKTSHALTAPLIVAVDDNHADSPFCHAFLGKKGDFKAVELLL